MKISVVVCTFNGAAYIEEQLNSILHQTRTVDEILLLDDGSEDGTVERAKQILEHSEIPWQVFQNDKNMGVARNFEKGIHLAAGDIVLTSDQDDVWLQNKVADFAEVFQQYPECVVAFSDAVVTDCDLRVLQKSLWAASDFDERKQRLFKEQRYYDVLFSDNVVTGAAMGIRKTFAEVCLPSPEGTLHDYWYALCAPAYGTIEPIQKADVLYRQHGKNVVGIPGKGLCGKIKRWFHTVKIMKADRLRRRIRAQELYRYLYALASGKSEHEGKGADILRLEKQAEQWAVFSVWRDSLEQTGRLRGVCQILFHAIKGDYRKYVNKTGVVLQDIAGSILPRREEGV